MLFWTLLSFFMKNELFCSLLNTEILGWQIAFHRTHCLRDSNQVEHLHLHSKQPLWSSIFSYVFRGRLRMSKSNWGFLDVAFIAARGQLIASLPVYESKLRNYFSCWVSWPCVWWCFEDNLPLSCFMYDTDWGQNSLLGINWLRFTGIHVPLPSVSTFNKDVLRVGGRDVGLLGSVYGRLWLHSDFKWCSKDWANMRTYRVIFGCFTKAHKWVWDKSSFRVSSHIIWLGTVGEKLPCAPFL